MIAPVCVPSLDTPDLEPGTSNTEPETRNRKPEPLPVDALWSILRDFADELLRGRAATLGRAGDEGARGDAYVFIADTIAGWVDRAERGEARGDGLDAERLLEEGMTRLWLRLNGSGRCGT
jgi:hypothetical protein